MHIHMRQTNKHPPTHTHSDTYIHIHTHGHIHIHSIYILIPTYIAHYMAYSTFI